MEKIYLSLVIPAYNEEENIKSGALESVYHYLKKQKYSWEVLIVDDGSIDKTTFLAEKFSREHKNFKVYQEPHRGKAGAVIAGMLVASGQIILFTDMDQATPINQLAKVLPQFERGKYDIVIGSRQGREGAPFIRKAMAYGFKILRILILGLGYSDTQCGFKAFNKKTVKQVFERMQVFTEKRALEGSAVTAGFDLELLYIAKKLGLKVVEVPVIWHHKGTLRVNPIKDSWQALKDLTRVRISAFLGRYNV